MGRAASAEHIPDDCEGAVRETRNQCLKLLWKAYHIRTRRKETSATASEVSKDEEYAKKKYFLKMLDYFSKASDWRVWRVLGGCRKYLAIFFLRRMLKPRSILQCSVLV